VSSSVGVAGSFAALLGDAILGGFGSGGTGMSCDGSPDGRCWSFPDFEVWPAEPRFHVLGPGLFRVSAIFE